MKRLTLFALLLCNIFCYSYAQEPGNYKPKNPNVIFRQSKLPIVIMNTNNTMIEKEDRVMIDMTIINNGDGKWNYADLEKYPDQTIEYQGKINIRYRGNTSFSLSEKKPYSIKTVNEDGSKNEVPLLDMPAHNDWVMLAPYSDRSMMRDILLHKLSRGYFEYSPIHRFCELQLDGTYYGVFLFGERQKRGDDRINVKKCGTSGINLTGGYHIQVDRNSEPVYSSLYPCKTSDDITLSKVTYYQYKYPEYEDMEQVQLDWINNRIHEFETSFMIDDYRDETVGYRNYIDVSSFI